MPYCSKCGSEIPQGAQFCPACGSEVKIEPAPISPTYTQTKTDSRNLFDRMKRAARLDPTIYEEVEADQSATTQAIMVVVLSSVCSGIGTGIGGALRGQNLMGIGIGLFGGLLSALVGWFLWSVITFFIGTNVFGGTASFGELLRTVGFSNSPGVLLLFSFIPILGGLISFAIWVWELVAMVVAVRQALDFSTGKAVLTCIVGWIAELILLTIMGILLALPLILLGL